LNVGESSEVPEIMEFKLISYLFPYLLHRLVIVDQSPFAFISVMADLLSFIRVNCNCSVRDCCWPYRPATMFQP